MAPSTVFSSSDAVKTITFTGNLNLSPDMSILNNFFSQLAALNAIAPVASITLTTLTLKDGRVATYSLTIGGPPPTTFNYSATTNNNWSAQELPMFADLNRTLNALQLLYGVTALTVTFN